MQRTVLLTTFALLAVTLSGCFGFQAGGSFDFKPGTDFEPTGNTVHLKAAVADLIMHEVYPGFHANLWAFCMAPADPNDKYSADAIEYWNTLDSDGELQGVDQSFIDNRQCSVPGPTLRVTQGDRVIVDFAHNHFHSHTIHWHGQHVPWQSDGVPGATQDSVIPGGSFRYDFIAAREGTLWYHCHVDTHFHVMQGLYGVIIVEPQNDNYEPKDIDKEYVFVYGTLRRDLVQVLPETKENPHLFHQHKPGECGASGVQNCVNPSVDVTPDTWTLNGRSAPFSTMDMDKSVIMVDEGDRVRIRLVNVGETVETIHTHGHDMLVTHRDGSPINPSARFWVDTLSIGPAERYDVVVEMTNPGLWMLHTHVDGHVTNNHINPGGGMSMIVYRSVLDEYNGDMMPFEAELVGQAPWILELDIPRDDRFGRDFSIGNALPTPPATTNVAVSWAFPWDLPCATRLVRVDAVYEPDLASAPSNLIDLSFSVSGPGGEPIDGSSSDMAGGTANWALDGRYNPLDAQAAKDTAAANRKVMIENMAPGAYTVQVAGTAPPGQLRLVAELDYFEDEAALDYEIVFTQLDLSKNPVSTSEPGLCSDAARVFDPSA